MTRLKWNKTRSEHASSKCGRFEIEALYMGTRRPQGYSLYDNETKKTCSADTIRMAKYEAEKIMEREAKQ